jgi:hypothetical protein
VHLLAPLTPLLSKIERQSPMTEELLKAARTGLVFRMQRDAILREMDVKKMEAFMRRHKQKVPNYVHPSVPIAMMHMARLQIRAFTSEEKIVSAKWLMENNYTNLPNGITYVDGILTGAEFEDD